MNQNSVGISFQGQADALHIKEGVEGVESRRQFLSVPPQITENVPLLALMFFTGSIP